MSRGFHRVEAPGIEEVMGSGRDAKALALVGVGSGCEFALVLSEAVPGQGA